MIAFALLSTLEVLNKKKIIHRDIKPENFLVSFKGEVKLADFGLAYKLEDGEKLNSFAGTFIYASPEARMTRMATTVPLGIKPRYDLRSDIFSVGLTLLALTSDKRLPINIEFTEPNITGQCYRNCEMKKNVPENVSEINKEIIKKLTLVHPRCRIRAIKSISQFKTSAFKNQDTSLMLDVKPFLVQKSTECHK